MATAAVSIKPSDTSRSRFFFFFFLSLCVSSSCWNLHLGGIPSGAVLFPHIPHPSYIGQQRILLCASFFLSLLLPFYKTLSNGCKLRGKFPGRLFYLTRPLSRRRWSAFSNPSDRDPNSVSVPLLFSGGRVRALRGLVCVRCECREIGFPPSTLLSATYRSTVGNAILGDCKQRHRRGRSLPFLLVSSSDISNDLNTTVL